MHEVQGGMPPGLKRGQNKMYSKQKIDGGVGGPLPEFNFKKMLNVGTAEKNWNQGN